MNTTMLKYAVGGSLIGGLFAYALGRLFEKDPWALVSTGAIVGLSAGLAAAPTQTVTQVAQQNPQQNPQPSQGPNPPTKS